MAVVCSHITPFGATLVATGMLLARKVISGERYVKTAFVFCQTAAVFFQTAAVYACSHKSSAKTRAVATDNDLQSSKLNAKVALVARFFSRALNTRARNEQICATGMTPKASSINNRNDRRTCGSYNIAERNLKRCW